MVTAIVVEYMQCVSKMGEKERPLQTMQDSLVINIRKLRGQSLNYLHTLITCIRENIFNIIVLLRIMLNIISGIKNLLNSLPDAKGIIHMQNLAQKRLGLHNAVLIIHNYIISVELLSMFLGDYASDEHN